MSHDKPTGSPSGPSGENSPAPAVSIKFGPLRLELDWIPRFPRWLTTAGGWLAAGGIGWISHWR